MEEYKAKKIVKLLEKRYSISKLTEEFSFVIAIKDGYIQGIYQLSHGTEDSCDMDMKNIFRFVLLIGADSFVVVHNHPNFVSRLSQDDYDRTREMITLSEYLRIPLLNHIVIGKNDYTCADKVVIKMAEENINNVNEYYMKGVSLCKAD